MPHRVFMSTLLGLGLLAASPSLAHADYYSVCDQWAKERDTAFFSDYAKVTQQYDAALKKQELWVDQFSAFIDANQEQNLKVQAIVDILLLGADTTGKTVSVALGLAYQGANYTGSKLLENLDKVEKLVGVASSGSVEEATFRAMGASNKTVGHAFDALSIFKGLLDAKDRFADRNATIDMLRKAEKKLRRNVQRARKDFDSAAKQLDYQTTFKNELDGLCSKIAPDARSCVSRSKIVDGPRSAHALKNTCDTKIYLFWCYVGGDAKNKKPCGSKSSYFTHNTTLEPGKDQANPYSMPGQFEIAFGACFGGYGTAKFDGEGGYYCVSKK